MKKLFKKILLALGLFVSTHTQLLAQSTAFTYQGRLNDNGAVASGNSDLRFAIYDTTSAGTQQ